MSKTVMTNEQLFAKLAEDYSLTSEAVQVKYSTILEGVKKDERFASADTTTQDQIARNRLITNIRRESNSPAITWEGVVLGAGDLIDGVGKLRKLSVEFFKVDPVKAQAGGMYQSRLVRTDADGNPIYPKTEANDKWNRTGTKLPEHSWLRTIFGVAQPIDKKTGKAASEVRKFVMTLNDKKAIDVKSILKGKYNKPLRFKGIDKTNTEFAQAGFYNIGDSAYTQFEIAPDLKLPPLENIIASVLSDRNVILGGIEEYHVANQEKADRWCVTEGTVSMLNLEPNAKTQNLFMILDDESLLFSGKEENSGVACWIPTDRGIEIDFAQDSRVYVIGKTSQGKKVDKVTKQKLDEPGDVNINVFGIYCPDMFKVVQETPKLSESALDTAPEEASVPTSEEGW